MTNAQAEWLQKNRPYRAIGNVPSGFRYVRTGILHGDGTFERDQVGTRPRVTQGCFKVGVLEQTQNARG